ncbi:MAG TPA: O-methyltransferase [Chitinophagaceae bacterium]|nr:O-methyltransferase [Chitinophagaceae bacterium]
MDNEIFGQVDAYISNLFNPADEALDAVEKSIIENGIPQISISPNQGKFLHIMAKLCHAKKILELGTLGGYSTIWLGRALPAGGKLITLEYSQHHANVAQKNIDRAGLTNVVEIRVGKALDMLPVVEAEGTGPFDFIFIDADKQPYAEYFEWALKLSRPGTLIIADNVIRDGKVLDAGSTDENVQGVQRLNTLLSKTTDVTATIIQTVGVKEYDGMAIALVN